MTESHIHNVFGFLHHSSNSYFYNGKKMFEYSFLQKGFLPTPTRIGGKTVFVYSELEGNLYLFNHYNINKLEDQC